MSFKVKTKKPGDLIRSEDWNEAMEEIENLNTAKLNLTGGDLTGPLKVTGKLNITGEESEWVMDGSEKGQLKIKSGNSQELIISHDGGIGIGSVNTHLGLTVNGPVIRKIWVATGLGPIDKRDSGILDKRVLSFKKLHNDSAIRIAYYDNFRAHSTAALAGGGRWEILIDNEAPPGGRIFQDFYSHAVGHINYHHPSCIVGFASGLLSGQHEITVRVGHVEGHEGAHPDRYTGWRNSRWTIEAEEVWIQE